LIASRPIWEAFGGECRAIHDFASHVQALSHFAENGIAAVHPRRLAERDVELARRGIGLGAVPGADRALAMDHFGVLLRIVQLWFEPVADAAVTGLAGAERTARFQRFVEMLGPRGVAILLAQSGMER